MKLVLPSAISPRARPNFQMATLPPLLLLFPSSLPLLSSRLHDHNPYVTHSLLLLLPFPIISHLSNVRPLCPSFLYRNSMKPHPDPIIEELNEDNEIEERRLKHLPSCRSSGGGGISKKEMENEDLPYPLALPLFRGESNLNSAAPHLPPPANRGMCSWDYFFPPLDDLPGPSWAEVDDVSGESEEEMSKEQKEPS